jgi:hypothetical protein
MSDDPRGNGSAIGSRSTDEIDGLRGAVNLVLYLCLVLAAEFFTLSTHANSEAMAVEVIWSTTVGLALAHIFAFDVASRLFSGGKMDRSARAAAVLQLAAAVVLAGLLSLPFLAFGEDTAMKVAGFVIAAAVGAAAYAVGRREGRSQLRCVVFGALGVAIATAVVVLKIRLSMH